MMESVIILYNFGKKKKKNNKMIQGTTPMASKSYVKDTLRNVKNIYKRQHALD